MVWPTLGSRTAKEQNRTEHATTLSAEWSCTCLVAIRRRLESVDADDLLEPVDLDQDEGVLEDRGRRHAAEQQVRRARRGGRAVVVVPGARRRWQSLDTRPISRVRCGSQSGSRVQTFRSGLKDRSRLRPGGQNFALSRFRGQYIGAVSVLVWARKFGLVEHDRLVRGGAEVGLQSS